MSSASLQNLSVKPNGDTNNTLLMPKLQFRFRVQFYNLGGAANPMILTRQVIDCQRPNLTFDEIPLPIYNSTVYIAGKPKWAETTINIRDDALSQASTAIARQFSNQLDFEQMASAASGKDYKFMTTVEVLDGGNGNTAVGVLETWELYGCWIKAANYNNLKYDANEAVTIALTVRYDNASLIPGNSIGGTIATGIGI